MTKPITDPSWYEQVKQVRRVIKADFPSFYRHEERTADTVLRIFEEYKELKFRMDGLEK
jgi:hypothetical protein